MSALSVILVCTRDHAKLSNELVHAGFAPDLQNRIETVLDSIRRGQTAGVLIDSDHIDVDLLELVLNVRDMDSIVPIAIVGQYGVRESLAPLLPRMENVLLLSSKPEIEKAVPAFCMFVKERATQARA